MQRHHHKDCVHFVLAPICHLRRSRDDFFWLRKAQCGHWGNYWHRRRRKKVEGSYFNTASFKNWDVGCTWMAKRTLCVHARGRNFVSVSTHELWLLLQIPELWIVSHFLRFCACDYILRFEFVRTIRRSLAGQDLALSPPWPGFESRRRNFFLFCYK